MVNNKIGTFPNILSLSRILLSPVLFMIAGKKIMLFLLLSLIGLTDVLDGFVARKIKKETMIGAWLDSIADFVFFISFIIYSVWFELEYMIKLQYFIIVIITIKLLSVVTGFIKYRQPGLLHTIANKITHIIVFAGLCVFVLFRSTIIVEIGLTISILTALEELVILLIGNKYEPNIKGIWKIFSLNKRIRDDRKNASTIKGTLKKLG